MPAYLDCAATTPMRPEAVDAMAPFLTGRFGNPSGAHAMARDARRALDDARDTVAGCLGCEPGEVVFTGSGTEADNLAIFGTIASPKPGAKVLCSAVEHHAVLHSCGALGARLLPVLPSGLIDLEALEQALDPSVALVSVMLANNEVGTVQPLGEVVDLVRSMASHAVVHTDAVAAFPWLDVAGLAESADLVAVSAHKFGGPKGVGALVVRRPTVVEPLIHGGGQEWGRRSGTHNVAGIAAMAAAMAATADERAAAVTRVGALRDRLADGLLDAVPATLENGERALKMVANCHLSFEGVESEALLALLDAVGVYGSAGSACASGATEPSHVLAAMGLSRPRALGALRLSLGVDTTDADVDLALAEVPVAVARLRG